MSQIPFNIEISPIAEKPTALNGLDYDFETDRIYTVSNRITNANGIEGASAIFSIELTECFVDPPIYKNYRKGRYPSSSEGFVVSINGEIAAAVSLSIEEWRSVTHIEDLLVGRKFRRHGLGSLLIKHSTTWALDHGCWSISAETQNVNYPAVQFYIRNGFEVWYVNQHLYPPGEFFDEVAIILGKEIK